MPLLPRACVLLRLIHDPMKASRDVPTCPRCGVSRVHRSHRRGLIEHTLAQFGAEMRRCYACRARQAWFGRTPIAIGDADRKRWRNLVLFGSGFTLCLLLLWWMISRFTPLVG